MSHTSAPQGPHATTILAVRRPDRVVIAGDGQVTLGNTVMKAHARKIRSLHDGKVMVGFAGSTADAFTLFDLFDAQLKTHNGQLRRAAVELAKQWRTDKFLRRLEALLIACDVDETLIISGSGDVVSPDTGIAAIGSGGKFAESAARALLHHTELDAETIARHAMAIAADICIYTNGNLTVTSLEIQ